MDNQRYSESQTVSDKEVIERVLKGEKELYGILVRRYNQRLYRVTMSILDNDTEADDVMQATYVNAYINLKKFAFKSSFATWLTRILINECFLRIKKGRRSVLMTEDSIDMHLSNGLGNGPRTPAIKAVNSELKQILEKAIKALPDKYRTVFVMREIEGMNIAETKACLGISEINVKVRLNRAKNILKESLSSFYNKEDILHFHLSRCDKIVDAVLSRIKSL